jgi:hypothetical protein
MTGTLFITRITLYITFISKTAVLSVASIFDCSFEVSQTADPKLKFCFIAVLSVKFSPGGGGVYFT